MTTKQKNVTTAIAMQQVRKYANVLEPMLGSSPRTIGVLMEVVFSMNPLRGC
jgi:hypothetical protein